MRHQSETIQPSFGESLKKERQRARNKDAQEKLDGQFIMDSSESDSSIQLLKNKCSSEIQKGSQLMTYQGTEDCSEDYWKQYSNSLIEHDQHQPKRFQDIKAQGLKNYFSSQKELVIQNKRLNTIIQKLTVDNEKLIQTVRTLEKQAQTKRTYLNYNEETENASDRIDQLINRIQELEQENRELNEENYHSWIVPQEKKSSLQNLQQKYERKIGLFEREIGRLRNELQGKTEEIFNLNHNSHFASQKIKQTLSQNKKLSEEVRLMKKKTEIAHFKCEELDKSYHSIAESTQRSIMILEQQVDYLEQENFMLKEKMDNLVSEISGNQQTDDKILNYCVEIDRLNKVLKTQIQARKKIQIQYDKLKQMIKLQNSLEMSEIKGASEYRTRSPKNEKSKILQEIKMTIAKSCEVLPQRSQEEVDILEDEVLRLESLLFEEESQSQSQMQQISFLEKQLQKFEVYNTRLQQRLRMMEKQLNDRSQEDELNIISNTSSAIKRYSTDQQSNNQREIAQLRQKYEDQVKKHELTLKKYKKMKINLQYSQNYAIFLQEEIDRHKNKKDGPILTQETLQQIQQIQIGYNRAVSINKKLSEDYSKLCQEMNKLNFKYTQNNQFYQNQAEFYQSEIQRLKQKNREVLAEYVYKINEVFILLAEQKKQIEEQKASKIIDERTIEQLERQVTQLRSLTKMNQSEKEELEEKIMHLEKEQARLGEEIKEIREEQEEDIQELEDLLDKLEIYEQQLDLLCQQNTELKQQLATESSKSQNLKKKLEEQEIESEETIVSIREEYEKQIRELLQQNQKEAKTKMEEQIKIDATINEFAQHIGTLEREMKVLKKTCEGIDNLKKEHAEYRDTVSQLTKDKKVLAQEMAEKEEVIKRIYDINVELSDHIKRLEEEIAAKHTLPIEWQSESLTSNEKYLDLQSKYKKVRQNEMVLQKKLVDVSIEFDKLKVFFMKLKNSEKHKKEQIIKQEDFRKTGKKVFC